MLRMLRLTAVLLVVSFTGLSGVVAAKQTQVIKWDNLMPKMTPLQNPLDALPTDLWDAFNDINYWKRLQEGPLNDARKAELKEAEKKAQKAFGVFEAKGVKPETVFKAQQDYLDEIERRGKLVVRELEGEQVAISGYLLPLNFSEEGIKEFLLVPYVGACIHVPPPPPNQMIYLTSEEAYKLKDMFEPVTVSGTLKIEAVSKKLSLVDGSEMVDSGYKMQAKNIGPYAESDSSE